ncbi:MAG TPA: hypothetical protein VF173_28995 [Thermoanaerobaculia bacterium]|nr:hypothetical protein [Thermoanaerobaculia bacterium]
MKGDHGSPLTPAQLMELYKIAVDEYRFQLTLNAARSRDYLVLNSAIIAAGVTLLGQKAYLLAGVVFIAGFLVATLAGLGTHTQHNYYREARDTKHLLESRLGIGGAVVKTTPAVGSRRWRFGSVTRFNYTIIAMLCTVNLFGALFSFAVLPLPTQQTRGAARLPVSPSPAPLQQRHSPHPSQPTARQPVPARTPP